MSHSTTNFFKAWLLKFYGYKNKIVFLSCTEIEHRKEILYKKFLTL